MKLRKWAELFVMVVVSLGTFIGNLWIVVIAIMIGMVRSLSDELSGIDLAFLHVCFLALLVSYSFMFFFIVRYVARGFKGPLFPRLYRKLGAGVFGVILLDFLYFDIIYAPIIYPSLRSDMNAFLLAFCVPLVVAILFVLFYEKLFALGREPYKSSARQQVDGPLNTIKPQDRKGMKLRKWAELFVMVIVSLGTFVANLALIIITIAIDFVSYLWASDSVPTSEAFRAYNRVFIPSFTFFSLALFVIYILMFLLIISYVDRGFKGPLFPSVYRKLSAGVFGIIVLFLFYFDVVHLIAARRYRASEPLSESVRFGFFLSFVLFTPLVVAILFVLFYDKLFASRREPYKSSAQ